MPKDLTKPFLLILLVVVLVGCYIVFRPFLTEILVAAILATIFYRPYRWFVGILGGRRNLSALIMCLLLVLVIILPSIGLLAYGAEKSVVAYSDAVTFFNENDLNTVFQSDAFQGSILKDIDVLNLSERNEGFKNVMLDFFKKSSDWFISGATLAVKETTSFVISLILIIMAMFFFFVDGKNILHKLMYLSPLPNKYDKEIFKKFRTVSYTTLISTFVTAAAQGVIGAIGFAIVGFPVFLAGILVALLSLIPYIGSMILYVPVGLFYLIIGDIWQGVFILLWGSLVIGNADNIIRTYMIKGKAEVNPVFVLFSILGGLAVFGFWGIIIGPLIVALAVTVFHIYELEFCASLDGCNPADEKKKLTKKRKK